MVLPGKITAQGWALAPIAVATATAGRSASAARLNTPDRARNGHKMMGSPRNSYCTALENSALAAYSQPERVTGIEPALSAWEADVLPLNYTRAHLHCFAGEPACAVFAQTSYRTR